jgi:hypothetical protein
MVPGRDSKVTQRTDHLQRVMQPAPPCRQHVLVTEQSRAPTEPGETQSAEPDEMHVLVPEQSQAPAEPDETQSAEPGETTQPEPATEHSRLSQDERAELERLRAEMAGLHRELEGMVRRRRVSWRSPVAIVLIVLGCLLAPVAVLGVWAGNQVSDTGRWVATVEPLIHDPAIQNALTEKITTQVTNQVDVPGLINQASAQLNARGLPRISSLLTTFSPQINSAVNGFIFSVVHSVITSPAAANTWVQVNTVAHRGLVKVLSGQGNGAFTVSNNQVVLNLGPFIAEVKQDLVARGFSVADKIPNVNPTFALFEAKDLGKAQAGYRFVNAFKIAAPIVAVLLLAAGVYVARRHRRALIWAGLGLAASMLILAIGLEIARSIYLGSVPSSVLPTDAAAAAYDTLIRFIRQSLRVVLVVGLVVAVGAYFTGPSAVAVRTRSGLKSGTAWIRQYAERRGVSAGPVGQWTYLHRVLLRVAAVAVAALILVFWGQPTALVVILLVVFLLLALGLIELIGRPPAETTAKPGAEPEAKPKAPLRSDLPLAGSPAFPSATGEATPAGRRHG